MPEQFYQARKKLGDEARNLPQGALGPFVNDEYSDIDFAVYAVEGHGVPERLLVRHAETLRERLLHVPGVKNVEIVGERPERVFVNFAYARLATLGVSAKDVLAALQRQNEVVPAGSIDTNGPQVYVAARRPVRRSPEDPRHADRRRQPAADAGRRGDGGARLRGSRDLPHPP